MKLSVIEQGRGPLVVLLHGFPEYSYSWRKQIPALVDAGFRVIAPDLRGYNDSPKPREIDAYRISAVIEDIAELIRDSGAEPCVLVGHDWGGVAAWYTAMTHPELVRKLVVLNSPHPKPLLRELKRSLSQRLRFSYQLLLQFPSAAPLIRPLLPLALRGRFTREERDEYRKSWKKPDAVRSMISYYPALRRSRPELRDMLRLIEAPTLYIFGTRDPVFTRATATNFDTWVPNQRVEFIEGAGHFVQTDAAERVNELLVSFARDSASNSP
jgi:pimeloyl-ACP methyl ester carboxylesterase